jgi:hypothetical protein
VAITVTSLGSIAQTSSVLTAVVTLAAGKSAAVGDLVVVGLSSGSSSATNTVTDSKGNTWTLGTAVSTSTPTVGRTQFAWSVLTTALVAGDTITCTSSATKQQTLDVMKAVSTVGWNGTSATVLDQQAGAGSSATGTAVSSGATAATTNANDLVVGCCGIANTAATLTPGTGYTASPTGMLVAGAKQMECEYLVAAATGAQTATATITSSGWQMVVAAFKESAGGGGGGPTVNTLAAMGVG